VFTYADYLTMPALLWDALMFIPQKREELKKKYGDHK
jgi:hypothetical protein